MKTTFLILAFASSLNASAQDVKPSKTELPALPPMQQAGLYLQKAGRHRNAAIGISVGTMALGTLVYFQKTAEYNEKVKNATTVFNNRMQAYESNYQMYLLNVQSGANVNYPPPTEPTPPDIKPLDYSAIFAILGAGGIFSVGFNISSNVKTIKAGKLLAQ